MPGSRVRPLTSLGHRSIAAAKLEQSPGPQMRARIREPERAAGESGSNVMDYTLIIDDDTPGREALIAELREKAPNLVI